MGASRGPSNAEKSPYNIRWYPAPSTDPNYLCAQVAIMYLSYSFPRQCFPYTVHTYIYVPRYFKYPETSPAYNEPTPLDTAPHLL